MNKRKSLRPDHSSNNSLNLRRRIEGATPNHHAYIKAIRHSDLTICEGMAGTGKTFIAVGVAMNLLFSNHPDHPIKRIVISRPVVPAGGEQIGFLPGDLHNKVDPYMRPINDAIWHFSRDAAEFRRITDKCADNPLIEVCPLAFMRGRTFDNTFIILDEAQNSTEAQMEMFLTRMGKDSKAVITGDLSQSDLPEQRNGLDRALHRFHYYQFTRGIVSICQMDASDNMRHGLITELLQAYRTPSTADRFTPLNGYHRPDW